MRVKLVCSVKNRLDDFGERKDQGLVVLTNSIIFSDEHQTIPQTKQKVSNCRNEHFYEQMFHILRQIAAITRKPSRRGFAFGFTSVIR